jgi:nucleoside 2-deoxyribosyltransferase
MQIYLSAPYFFAEQVNLNIHLITALRNAGHVVRAEQEEEMGEEDETDIGSTWDRRRASRISHCDAMVAVLEDPHARTVAIPNIVESGLAGTPADQVRYARSLLGEALAALESGEPRANAAGAAYVQNAVAYLGRTYCGIDSVIAWEMGCATPCHVPVIGFSRTRSGFPWEEACTCVARNVEQLLEAARLLANAINPKLETSEYLRQMEQVRAIGKR